MIWRKADKFAERVMAFFLAAFVFWFIFELCLCFAHHGVQKMLEAAQ